jgi:hypothetical protein
MNQTYEHDSLKALNKVAGREENSRGLKPVELTAWKRNPQKSGR